MSIAVGIERGAFTPRWILHCTLAGFLTLAPGCGSPFPQPRASLDVSALTALDREIEQAIAEKRLPGGVLWVERLGQAYHRPYGNRALEPRPERMTEPTLFDLASLTKVVATTPAILLLIERGKIDFESPVRSYLPQFRGGGREAVQIRHLLTHTSGLPPGLSLHPAWSGKGKAIELACAEPLLSPPGTAFRYSDINFILLGEIVERVSGTSLNGFAAREIFDPLRMERTGFLPRASEALRAAPTEKVGGVFLRGVVHDPTARRMGGVAGHAGLFSTASDLARFARLLLGRGQLDGVQIFKPETVDLMTRVQTPPEIEARRGLGWDIETGYSRPRGQVFPRGSYGHTGFTGTCLWIDPFSETFWIFLSNRVHPDGKGNILPLQQKLGTLAANAVNDFDFAHVPGALPPPAIPVPASLPAAGGSKAP